MYHYRIEACTTVSSNDKLARNQIIEAVKTNIKDIEYKVTEFEKEDDDMISLVGYSRIVISKKLENPNQLTFDF